MSFAFKILLVAFSLTLTSCGQSEDPAEEVVLLVRTGPEADGLKEVAEAYERETGNIVEVREIGRDQYMSAMPTQIRSGRSSADVVFVPSTMIAEFAKLEAIVPLSSDYVSDEDLLVVYEYEDEVFGVPSDLSTLFLAIM